MRKTAEIISSGFLLSFYDHIETASCGNHTKGFIKFTEWDQLANNLTSRGSCCTEANIWNLPRFSQSVVIISSPSTFIAAAKNHFQSLVCPLHQCRPPRSRCTGSYIGLCLQKGRCRPPRSCILPLPHVLSPRPPDACFRYCVAASPWSPQAWRGAERSMRARSDAHVLVSSNSPKLLFLKVLNVIFVEDEADLRLHLLSLLDGIHNHEIAWKSSQKHKPQENVFIKMTE